MSDAKRVSTDFERGVFCGMALMIASAGLHWFITPPGNGPFDLRSAAVVFQVVAGFGVAYWMYRKARPRGEVVVVE